MISGEIEVNPGPILPLVVVAGPTASGKSALAIELAQEFGGEVVNCDSQQVYRGLDVGTAKLAVEERRGIPHHFIDIVDPAVQFTAAEFSRSARSAIQEIENRGKLPILCGGTGFYLRALVEGLSPAPEREPELRMRLVKREEFRPGSLHRILTRLSLSEAARIHPNDLQKTIRALEVVLLTGGPASSAPRQPLENHLVIKLVLDPPVDILDDRIRLRSKAMFGEGLLDEVRTLLATGVPPDSHCLASIGYKQALLVLEGKMSGDEAIAETSLRTRQYAKRQRTWFRREQQVVWLHGFGDDPKIQKLAQATLHRSLFPTSSEPAAS